LWFIGACLPLLIGAAPALRNYDNVWRDKSAERAALVGLLAASTVGALAGARFHHHYYIQLIPPLALLAAPHYARFWTGRTQPPHWLLRPGVTFTWLALTLITFSIAHWRGLVWQRESSETGRYLLNHSASQDRIFVWGQASNIYLDARRRPASRFIASYPLTGSLFGGPHDVVDTRNHIMPDAWATLEQDFARHAPVFIVDVQVPAKNARYPVKDFPILAKLIAERYRPVARVAEGVIYRLSDGR
jgi:hypothetical protein